MWKSKARFLNSKLYSIWSAQRTKQNFHLTFNLCIPFLNWFALVNQSLQMEFFVQIVPGRIIAAATHSSPHCWPWNMTSQNRSVWLNKTCHADSAWVFLFLFPMLMVLCSHVSSPWTFEMLWPTQNYLSGCLVTWCISTLLIRSFAQELLTVWEWTFIFWRTSVLQRMCRELYVNEVVDLKCYGNSALWNLSQNTEHCRKISRYNSTNIITNTRLTSTYALKLATDACSG